MEALHKRAFVFPGQGSQAVGMGSELARAFPVARMLFQEVDDLLEENLSKLIFEGPQDTLTETHHAQPALMAVSVAVLRVMEKEFDFSLKDHVDVVAGHSLGEYTALLAAHVLPFSAVVKLLRLRGRAMQEALPKGEGAMAAILKLSVEKLETMPKPGTKTCVIANDNARGQVVISGHKQAVDEAMQWAVTQGGRAILLPVSSAFHSPLMSSAYAVMEEVLEKQDFRVPLVPVITNVGAAPETNPQTLRQNLTAQMVGRVRWRETMDAMEDIGIKTVVEVGAGQVLTGLAKRQMTDISLVNLHTPQDIETFMNELNHKKAER